MTDPVKLLSDDEVAEIERVIESSPCATFPMTTEEARALCATVRALESALRKANEIVEEAAQENMKLQLANTALREQLAQVELARNQLSDGLSVRDAQLKELQSQLANLRQKLAETENG